MIEVLHSDNSIYIVLELCPGGELFDYVISCKRLQENMARRLFQQLIDGIEYCHSMVGYNFHCTYVLIRYRMWFMGT